MRASLFANLLVPFFTCLVVSLSVPAAAQNETATPTTAAIPAASAGLTEVKSRVDTLRVLPAAFAESKPLRIAVMPLHVEYPKRRHDMQPYYRESDFRLSPRDMALLQKTLTDAFTNAWFKQRQWQLVNDPATADLKLFIELKNFWLAAPLKEDITVSRTYTEESARFTLSGRIERAGDQQHVVEFSDKRKVKQLGVPPGRMDRFNVVTFWRDMRLDLETAARLLERDLPSGKNGHKS